MNMWKRVRENSTAYLLIAPAVALMMGMTLYPALYVINLSFTNLKLGRVGAEYIGFQNYFRFFQQPISFKVLSTTIIFIISVSIFAIGLGLIVALLLNYPLRFRRIFRSIAIIPWTLTAVIAGAMWRWLLASKIGIVPYMLNHYFDLYLPIFLKPTLSLMALIIVETWRSCGYSFIFILAGLQGIDPTYQEAADIDGASTIKKFLHITFPLLTPTLLVVLILMTIRTLGLVAIVLILTGGGPFRTTETLAFHVWQESFHFYDIGYGSAVAVIMLLFNLILALIYFRTLRSEI